MIELTKTDSPDSAQQSLDNKNNQPNICCQAGFLPVPIQHIPPNSLTNLNLFLEKSGNYSLYRKRSYNFTPSDKSRLVKSGVEFLYISVKDHHHYYQTIEESLSQIIKDPKIRTEKKAEILYSTSIELANQLLTSPPGAQEIARTRGIAKSTVQMIIKDSNAFDRLTDISNHDFYTATHMVNVCSSVVYMAAKMGMNDIDTLEKIGTGAILHDIGKIFIPPEILNATDKLTTTQRDAIMSHVDLGCNHLKSVMGDIDPETYSVISEHHERMDGTGYPKGLKGSEISPIGRLAAIVDTFEAMTSVRPYRQGNFSVEEALCFLEDNSTDKYDKDIVKSFATMIQKSLDIDCEDQTQQTNDPLNLKTGTNQSGRMHQRYNFRLQAPIRSINNFNNKLTLGDIEKVILHNISASGAGFLSARPFPLNDNFCITIPEINDGKPLVLSATIIRCINHNDGWFTIGAKFHKVQNEEFVKEFRKEFI